MSGTPPSNLERDEEGGVRRNPNWYEGTRWRFEANEQGDYRLSLHANSGQGATMELTAEQASTLLYAAQAGELDDYGDYLDRE